MEPAREIVDVLLTFALQANLVEVLVVGSLDLRGVAWLVLLEVSWETNR